MPRQAIDRHHNSLANNSLADNPLVPNAALLGMYEAMLRLRALSRSTAQGVRPATRGQEACYAASLLSLTAADLVSDRLPRHAVGQALFPAGRREQAAARAKPCWLPALAVPHERTLAALGAAQALRLAGGSGLVLLFLHAADLTRGQWTRTLALAGETQAPLLLTVLPGPNTAAQGALSDRAQGCGTPGMPVDAADPVALYRVLQEAILRARAGDGPALIECIAWRPQGMTEKPADPLTNLRQVLRRRGLSPATQR